MRFASVLSAVRTMGVTTTNTIHHRAKINQTESQILSVRCATEDDCSHTHIDTKPNSDPPKAVHKLRINICCVTDKPVLLAARPEPSTHPLTVQPIDPPLVENEKIIKS